MSSRKRGTRGDVVVRSNGEPEAFAWSHSEGQVSDLYVLVGCFGGPSAKEEVGGLKLGDDTQPLGAEFRWLCRTSMLQALGRALGRCDPELLLVE